MSSAIATARLLEDALQLPDRERADLVAQLLASLSPATPAEARTDDGWLFEIERRARAALTGSPGIPWDEAQRQIQQRLARTKR